MEQFSEFDNEKSMMKSLKNFKAIKINPDKISSKTLLVSTINIHKKC